MPIGTNALELKGFFSGLHSIKSIQKNYKFFVTFWDDDITKNSNSETGPMPIITHWHIKNVSIPQYTFQKEVVKYGPLAKSFPVLDLNGLDVVVGFEEDNKGTIAYFINWLQRKIVRQDGTYRSQKDNRIDNLVITTEDDMGSPINIFWFKNIFFQGTSSPSFDYSGNDAIGYDITFGADYMKFLPIKALANSDVTSTIVSGITGG